MASGRTHERVAITVSAASLGTFFFLPVAAATCFIAGTLNGLMVTPDIDVDHQTREERRLKGIPVIGWFVWIAFSTVWYPYALAFPHRGLSHFPVLGTLTRALWQAILLGLFMSLPLYLSGAVHWLWENMPWECVLLYFSGWCVQDFGHLVFDNKRIKIAFRWLYHAFLTIVVIIIVLLALATLGRFI